MSISILASTMSNSNGLQWAYLSNASGGTWSASVTVDSSVESNKAAGCKIAGGWGALFTRVISGVSTVYWKTTPNPLSWAVAATSTGLTGNVWGLARNEAGVMCAVISTSVYISRNNGTTWVTGGTVSGLTEPSSITYLNGRFVIVMVNGDGTPRHWVSSTGGASWS